MGSAAAERAPAASPARAAPAQAQASRPARAPAEAAAERLPGGAPLPPTTRQRMERSFGRSFADVRVHAGPEGAAAAGAFGAEAFTVGDEITFGAGKYRPGSEAGDRLIAHELAHVAQQQGASRGAAPARSGVVQPKSEVSTSAEPAEQEAEAAADRVLRSEPAGVRPGGAPSTRQRILRRALAGAPGLPVMSVAAPVATPAVAAVADLAGVPEDVAEAAGPEAQPLPLRRRRRRLGEEAVAAEQRPEAQAERAQVGSAAEQIREKEAEERERAEAPPERAQRLRAGQPPAILRAPVALQAAAARAPAAQRLAAGQAQAKARAEAGAEERARTEVSAGKTTGVAPAAPASSEKAPAGTAAVPGAKAAAPGPAGKVAASGAKAPAGAQAIAQAGVLEMGSAEPAGGAGAAPAAPEAATAAGGGGGGSGDAGGAGAEADAGGGGAASPEAEAVEEKMDAAQPEEEAAAEAQVDGDAEATPEAEAEAPEAGGGGPAPEAAAPEPAAGGAEPDAERAADGGGSPEAAAAKEPEVAQAAAAPAPAPEEAAEDAGGGAEDGALSPGERDAALASLAEGGGGGGEGGGGGGGGGGGAIADKPAPEAPDVSGAEPKAALATAGALPPAQLKRALGGVAQSVARTVGERRAELAENAPSMAAPTGMPARAAPLQVPEAAGEGGKKKPEKAAEGKEAPTPAPEPTPAPPPSPAEAIATPAVSGGAEGLSAGDAARMQASIANLPTSDPDLDTSAGPAPALALSGNADPAQAEAQQAQVDATVADAHRKAQADAAQPMGEDEIAPVASDETLEAEVAGGAGGGAGGAAGGAGKDEETASIVAEQERGGEIRAAVAQGQAEMASEEEGERQSSEAERQRSRAQIDQDVQAAADAQLAEKGSARQDADAQRAAWTEAQHAAVDKGRAEADGKLSDVHTKVTAEKQQADTTAGEALASGEREARAAKSRGEAEAQREKQKASAQSNGFLGWVVSQATAVFDSIKAGIKAAIAAARKAVKGAIEKAKQRAVAAIEAARNAVIAAIRAAGEALLAIGDVVLAAFPEARAKYRKAIEDGVRAAEETVNRIADDLKKGVQKRLDALGSFLDAALGLLEKGLLAALAAVAEAVEGALKWAQSALDALAGFAALVKDIAAGPGQWLSNLGAAVVDGIKNHLWKALKSAIASWFNEKLEEVLGLGTTIFNVLFKGGISLAEVGKMAWEALKAAIPGVLVQILVEKLVSMIIPAAGAVMVIVEGLMAAWGTVSKILQAINRFITFLKAVKGGNAGPQFASAVAAAAVAVIAFVANWLVARLRRPAGKVAGKLKAIAQKILKKIKKALKKIGKALKKGWKKLKGKFKKLFTGKKKGKKDKGADKSKRDQDKLDRAERALRPVLAALLRRGVSGVFLRARLGFWRVRYGLTRLSLEAQGQRFRIRAVVNPIRDLNEGLSKNQQKIFDALKARLGKQGVVLLRIIREVAEELMTEADATADKLNAGPPTGGERKVQVGRDVPTHAIAQSIWLREEPDTLKLKYEYASQVPNARTKAGGLRDKELLVRETYGNYGRPPQPQPSGRYDVSEGQAKTFGVGGGGDYSDVASVLMQRFRGQGMNDADIAHCLATFSRTREVPKALRRLVDARGLAALLHLLFVRETARSRANLTVAVMMNDLVHSGAVSYTEMLHPIAGRNRFGGARYPMSMENATAASRKLDDVLGMEGQRGLRGSVAKTLEIAQREYDMVVEWLKQRIHSKARREDPKFDNNEASVEEWTAKELNSLMEDRAKLKNMITLRIRAFYRKPPDLRRL